MAETGGEILKNKYKKVLQDVQNVSQRNLALLANKDDLNQTNNALEKRIEELMNELDQLTKANKELTKSNNAFKIILQITEDERNFYKTANFEEFNKFVDDYVFGDLAISKLLPDDFIIGGKNIICEIDKKEPLTSFEDIYVPENIETLATAIEDSQPIEEINNSLDPEKDYSC
ncbi:2261_t:CDS:2 [Gigaspora margarita]|uniref:2261_t:CDS:1 n=1 Tax=Gigaspora margarita TaxID=4874 RepID=A0ABN7V8Y3_GIGMA|nr:2261_t:CDS:2 [Gigaspora margarita]